MGRIWVPRANRLLKKCSWPFDVLYVPRPGADLSGDTDLPADADGLGVRAHILPKTSVCGVLLRRNPFTVIKQSWGHVWQSPLLNCQEMSFWASYISARKSVGRIWVPRANRLLKKCSWPFDVLYVPRPGADLSGDTDLPADADGLGLRAHILPKTSVCGVLLRRSAFTVIKQSWGHVWQSPLPNCQEMSFWAS